MAALNSMSPVSANINLLSVGLIIFKCPAVTIAKISSFPLSPSS